MTPTGPNEFGARLRRFRERAALSQEDLAERADMTAKAVGALERGERRRPYPRTVRALSDALGLDEAERSALATAIPRSASSPLIISSDAEPVPTPPTTMYGRDAELRQLLDLLAAESTRLVTITGPGGVGKTRLASEVAATWPTGGAAPVVAELAPVRDAELVLPTVSRALGLQVPALDLVASVAALLGDRDQLLVIDNMEHLLGAAAGIADLVARCPRLTVLTTSRAPLRARAELEFPLGPLDLPTTTNATVVAESAAAHLFVERARAVVPGFMVDDANAPAIAAICIRLDGLPLALELAAPHVRYLDAHQLLDRLDRVVDAPGPRDAPARQQTMRATLDWSYDLLTAEEQRLLRAVSVFAGGFELDALEHVADADVLAALQGLVEHSLVLTAPSSTGAGQRLRTLEPVRGYAAALTSASERSELVERHAAYFVDLGRAARSGLHGLDQPHWLDRLAAEHANLRAALGFLLADGRCAEAADLGGNTWLYWALRGHAGEALAWLEGVLARSGPGEEGARAMAHLALAGLRFATGDIAAVAPTANRSVVAWRDGGDRALLAEALVLASSGEVFIGDVTAATAHLDELSVICSSLGDGWARSHELIARAQLALLLGDIGASRAALVAAERLARESAGPFTLATALNMQATVAQLAGDDDSALAHAAEAARVAVQVGTTWTLVYSLPMLALQAARRARPALAVTMFAAGAAIAEASLLAVSYRPDIDAADVQLDSVRAALTEDDFRRAWERGRTLGLDDIIGLIPEILERRGPG